MSIAQTALVLGQLPDQASQQGWIDTIPPRENFVINPKTFWICENHWPTNTPMKKHPGGQTRPLDPPSIFNVPSSCLPTPKVKAPHRAPKDHNKNLNLLLEKDKIKTLLPSIWILVLKKKAKLNLRI